MLSKLVRLDEITPNKLPRRIAPTGGGGKRKGDFDVLASRKVGRPATNGNPGTFKAPNRGDVQGNLKYAQSRWFAIPHH
jgi:hypothetical protein